MYYRFILHTEQVHECHGKTSLQNAKSQFEQAKIPPENPKTQFENAKAQKTTRVLAQVFLDRRSKKALVMHFGILGDNRTFFGNCIFLIFLFIL